MSAYEAVVGPVNRWADRLEDRLPWALKYNGIGDPASWYFSHPAFCAAGALVGALVGAPLGMGRLGLLVGWAAVAAFYTIVREPLDGFGKYRAAGWRGAIRRVDRNPYGGRYQVGWLVDGVLDVVFCWLFWWLLAA